MAFPTIPSGNQILTTVTTPASVTHTFPSLTTLTQAAGDLMIAICVTGNSANAAEFSGWGGGFTEFADQFTTAVGAIGAAYKWADGTETGTFTVTTVTSCESAQILMTIPGAHASTVPEAGGYATGTLAAPDPGSLDPAGWGTEDTLWIAVGASIESNAGGSFTGLSAGPSGYSGYIETGISSDIVGGLEGGVAFLQSAAASVDPGAFSGDATNVRWTALTIAVRSPVVTNVDVPDAATATGTSNAPSRSVATSIAAGSASGAGQTPQANIEPVVAAGTGSGAGLDATVDIVSGPSDTDAPAELASGTGSAYQAGGAGAATAGEATGSGAGGQGEAWLDIDFQAPAATGTAYDATVDAVSGAATNAPAELATATGTANAATVLIASGTGTAGATGAAGGSTSTITTTPTTAAATGAALQPSIQTTGATNVNAGHAAGTGAGNGVTATIASGTGAAGATGATASSNGALEVHPTLGTATGAASGPTVSTGQTNVTPLLAVGTGVAFNPLILAVSNFIRIRLMGSLKAPSAAGSVGGPSEQLSGSLKGPQSSPNTGTHSRMLSGRVTGRGGSP